MARQKSAVLSVADKKAVLTKTKADLKAARDAVKASEKAEAVAAKLHATAAAALTKQAEALGKVRGKAIIAHVKAHAALVKTATKLEADLEAMTPAPVVLKLAA